MNDIKNKQRELSELQQKANRLQSDINNIQKNCSHDWCKTMYDPIYIEGYTIPGDPPGTMGVDWRGPCHVPSSTTHQWKRKCKICELEQTTKRTKMIQGNSSIDGCKGSQEVPDFD